MDNLIIHSIKYINNSHDQAVANITYQPVNGNEPFSYFILLKEEDDAPIHQYLRSKIDSGEIKIQPPDTVSDEVIANEVRDERDALLSETDKYMTLDYPITDESKQLLREYRQALRDIPDQDGFPHSIVWPQKPEIIKLKKSKS